jgi:hypothetical protein
MFKQYAVSLLSLTPGKQHCSALPRKQHCQFRIQR